MMSTLRDVSHVGEYVGEGRGDVAEDDCQLDTDQGDQLQQNPGGGEEVWEAVCFKINLLQLVIRVQKYRLEEKNSLGCKIYRPGCK